MTSDPERGECQDCEELRGEVDYLEAELAIIEEAKWAALNERDELRDEIRRVAGIGPDEV